MQDFRKILVDGLLVLEVKNGDLTTVDGFETALLVSLHTNQRLSESEVARPLDRSGWLGNVFTPGRELGGKVWYYENMVITTSALAQMKEAVTRSLDWMITDQIATAKSAKVTAQGQTLSVDIPITGRDGIKYDYKYLWNKTKGFIQR